MTEIENILICALISAGHIVEQARTEIENLKVENTELRHRAEVAERALDIAEKNDDFFVMGKDEYLLKAEKELQEDK